MKKPKLVDKEPKFEPTDDIVSQVEDFIFNQNWCRECGRAIPLHTKYCPYCRVEQ